MTAFTPALELMVTRPTWLEANLVVDHGDLVNEFSLARAEDLAEIRALLASVFDDRRFADEDHLRWQYLAGPFGPAYSGVGRSDGRAVGHLGVLPRRMLTVDGTLDVWMIVNIASAPGSRGGGSFARLFADSCRIVRDYDQAGVFGSMNAASAKFNARNGINGGNLPLRMLVPGPYRRRFRSVDVTPELVGSSEFDELVAGVDLGPRRGIRMWWHADHLRWRLASPLGRYAIHVGDGMTAITSVVEHRGVRAAALMKVFVTAERRAADGLGRTRITPAMVGEWCRHHRVPALFHVGFNADVSVPGVVVPPRFLPSPLYLGYHAVRERVETVDFRFDTFELLELDLL